MKETPDGGLTRTDCEEGELSFEDRGKGAADSPHLSNHAGGGRGRIAFQGGGVCYACCVSSSLLPLLFTVALVRLINSSGLGF